MNFEYPERQLAYDSLRKEIEKSGYTAGVFGMGGYSEALQLAVRDFSDRSRSFGVSQSARGWFLHLPQTCFSISTSVIFETCLSILDQLESATSHDVCQRIKGKQEFTEVTHVQWNKDHLQELQMHWRQHGWTPLSYEEADVAWDRFYHWFREQVDADKGKVLGCSYCQGWDLGTALPWPIGADENKLEAPLTLELLTVLKTCDPSGFPLYALDRHHPCYLFDPRAATPIATRNYWAVPFLPLDNNYYFLSQCYSYGVLGLYVPKRLIVFGEKMRPLEGKVAELLENARAL